MRAFAILGGVILTVSLLVSSLTFAQSIKLDGSLGSRTTLTGPAYTIPHDLGQTRGANLFHSFEQFNVLTGESAIFTGPNTIQRVISRVTGGVHSFIDGLLGTDFAGAKPEFYLINPSGLLFGPNASLNVSGSVHFSTADYLRMADSVRFYSALGINESTLSVESVAAFGFLTSTPAPITVQRTIDGFFGGADLSVPAGHTLSFFGGDLTMGAHPLLGQNGISTVSAPSGLVQLASVKSPGEVPANLTAFNVTQAGPLGEISLAQGALVSASGDGGGAVVIRGGKLTLDNAYIFADTLGAEHGAPVAVDAKLADQIALTNGAFLTANPTSTGQGGSIMVGTQSLTVEGGSVISTSTFASGNSGTILIEANYILAQGGGEIASSTFGPGSSGLVTLVGDLVTLRGTGAGGLPSGVGASSLNDAPGTGNAGSVVIQAKTLLVEEGAQLSSSSFGPGNGGSIAVTADTVMLRGRSTDGRFPSGFGVVAAGTDPGAGNAGKILVQARTLTVDGGASIASSSQGPGAGGSLTVAADTVILRGTAPDGVNRSGLFASTDGEASGAGNAGNISVEAQTLTIERGGAIASVSRGSGSGGTITVMADTLTLTDGTGEGVMPSVISASAQSKSPGGGNAGNVVVEANSLSVEGGSGILSFTNGPGAGGTISVTADSVSLHGIDSTGIQRSGLFANSQGTTLMAGPAGGIFVNTNRLSLDGGATISSISLGSGNGGSITLTGDTIAILGSSPDGKISSAIGATAEGTDQGAGHAGNIVVQAKTLTLEEGGQINTSSFGPGTGGSVTVSAETVSLHGASVNGNPSALSANARSRDPGAGNAGNIEVKATNVMLEDGAQIASASVGPGAGGTVSAAITGELSLSGFGTTISAVSTGGGVGGDIQLSASLVNVMDHASISATSSGLGNAGNITLTAGDTIRLVDSQVTSAATVASGGNVKFTAPNMIQIVNGQIVTLVQGGAQTVGGNINIDPQFVVLQNSQILATATQGNGGNITIAGNVVMVDPGSVIDASSALGVSGRVAIQAPVNNVATALSRLSQTPLNATELLTARCAARLREGRTSSLTLAGRDGVPAEPGSWRPTSFLNTAYRPSGAPALAARPVSTTRPPLLLQSPSPELYALRDAAPLPLGCGS